MRIDDVEDRFSLSLVEVQLAGVAVVGLEPVPEELCRDRRDLLEKFNRMSRYEIRDLTI